MKGILSEIYGAGIKLRGYLYNIGFFSRISLPAPVISIGNITVGGTGKSPLVNHLVEKLLEKKIRPLVISRGYKRKNTNSIYIPANAPASTVEEIGDEPFLLKNKYPECAILVSKNRSQFAADHWAEIKADIVILDDAFQHWKLRRDIDIVTIDLSKDIWPKLLPAGRARELPESLCRADIIIFTHVNEITQEESETKMLAVIEFLTKQCKTKKNNFEQKIFLATGYRVNSILTATGARVEQKQLEKAPVVMISGIGNPASFQRVIEKMNSTILNHVVFPDHYWCSSDEILEIVLNAKKKYSDIPYFIVTEKDFVRWQKNIPADYKKYFLYPTIEIDFYEKEFPALPLSSKEKLLQSISGLLQ